MSKTVSVLFLDSLEHAQEFRSATNFKPHQDEINFADPVEVALVRIPRAGKQIYARHTSITQGTPIKNFEIYFRNLNSTAGRFSLLTSNTQLVAGSTDDVLITPKVPIFTDLIVVRGNFTKISIVIYGRVLSDPAFVQEYCPNYKNNAPIAPLNENSVKIVRDIFEEKAAVIHEIEQQIAERGPHETWHQIVNDDGTNEQQIENISCISQKLYSSLTPERASDETFIVQFRKDLQEVSTNLAKIFKNKSLGLYYQNEQDYDISKALPVSLIKLTIKALEMSLSDQFRSLEVLRYLLQLKNHANFFIQNQGVTALIKIFGQFFQIGSVVLSTYKNLLLQCLISLSQWINAAQQMTTPLQHSLYQKIFKHQKQPSVDVIKEEPASKQRSRSRDKKSKKYRSRSDSSKSKGKKKKDKSDKHKKKNKDRHSQKEKKKSQEPKAKEQVKVKVEEITENIEVPQQMNFYEVVLVLLSQQKNHKHLVLLKILFEQIGQTLTKSVALSQRVSASTSLLKDTKYLFSPAGEVMNTKTLKLLASYQPFLNSVQSEGVDSSIVSQKEKLRQMGKFGIDQTMGCILNRINFSLACNYSEEGENEARTAFDESFIVMMSAVVRKKPRGIFYGFSRLLNAFRVESSHDLMYLKKIEAATTMISEYIYGVLLEDDSGLNTVLYIDQIYGSLINITNCLSKDSSVFTKQLKKKIRLLMNYAMAYDLFTKTEGNFKAFCDYFLKLFRFEHYEVNKITDFKKKEFDRLRHPYSWENLTEVLKLGNLHAFNSDQLQPLLEIDVCLKIFNIMVHYNKNLWTLFYEQKILSGLSHLFLKLSNITVFLITPSPERHSAIQTLHKYQLTVENYLTVIEHTLNLLIRKSDYEAAFTDLLDEDIFQHVQFYDTCLDLYIAVYTARNDLNSLFNQACSQRSEGVLSKIAKVFDKLIESYELNSHSSRQNKIRHIVETVLVTHYTNLATRSATLSLISIFFKVSENNSLKFISTLFLGDSFKFSKHTLQSIGFVPLNQLPMLENIFNLNMFRNDPHLQSHLVSICNTLIEKNNDKNNICDKIAAILLNMFQSLEGAINGSTALSRQSFIALKKMCLFTNLLKHIAKKFSFKLAEKLLRYIKSMDVIRSQKSIAEEGDLQDQKLCIQFRIKANAIVFLSNYLLKEEDTKIQSLDLLSFIQTVSKYLTFSEGFFERLQHQQISFSEMDVAQANLIDFVLATLSRVGSDIESQSIILYEFFLENPYKPNPQVNFIGLMNTFMKENVKEIIQNSDPLNIAFEKTDLIGVKLKDTLIRVIYFLCQLTTLDGKEFYCTQSRRNAIASLVSFEKDFPFSIFASYESTIPFEMLNTLKDYFAFPVIEKPMTLLSTKRAEKVKNKGMVYSKCVFSMIMEGEQTAKARYQFIGGQWKAGDVKSDSLFSSLKEKHYSEMINEVIPIQTKGFSAFTDKVFPSQNRPQQELVELYDLNTSNYMNISERKAKVVDKKSSIETQIKLTKVPHVFKNHSNHYRNDSGTVSKRISPSPTSRNGPNISSMNESGQKQGSENRRVSPSPPAVMKFGPTPHQNDGPTGMPHFSNGQKSSTQEGPSKNSWSPEGMTNHNRELDPRQMPSQYRSEEIKNPYRDSSPNTVNRSQNNLRENSGSFHNHPNGPGYDNSPMKHQPRDSQNRGNSYENQRDTQRRGYSEVYHNGENGGRNNPYHGDRNVGHNPNQLPSNYSDPRHVTQPYPLNQNGGRVSGYNNYRNNSYNNHGQHRHYDNSPQQYGHQNMPYNGHSNQMGYPPNHHHNNPRNYGNQYRNNNYPPRNYDHQYNQHRHHNEHQRNDYRQNFHGNNHHGGMMPQHPAQNMPPMPMNYQSNPSFGGSDGDLFQEAVILMQEIKGVNLPEAVRQGKKDRLNALLIAHPQFQERLREYFSKMG